MHVYDIDENLINSCGVQSADASLNFEISFKN